jgi:hypothetical protein
VEFGPNYFSLQVAYFVATLVDDGEGVVFQAARTHPDHRQLGYYNYLKKAAANELKTLYPNLKEVLFTAGSSTPNDTLVYSLGGGRKILLSKVNNVEFELYALDKILQTLYIEEEKMQKFPRDAIVTTIFRV